MYDNVHLVSVCMLKLAKEYISHMQILIFTSMSLEMVQIKSNIISAWKVFFAIL